MVISNLAFHFTSMHATQIRLATIETHANNNDARPRSPLPSLARHAGSVFFLRFFLLLVFYGKSFSDSVIMLLEQIRGYDSLC